MFLESLLISNVIPLYHESLFSTEFNNGPPLHIRIVFLVMPLMCTEKFYKHKQTPAMPGSMRQGHVPIHGSCFMVHSTHCNKQRQATATQTSTSKVLLSCSDLMLTSFCTSRAAFVVYYTSVDKISLLYKCRQNQLTLQVYTNCLPGI